MTTHSTAPFQRHASATLQLFAGSKSDAMRVGSGGGGLFSTRINGILSDIKIRFARCPKVLKTLPFLSRRNRNLERWIVYYHLAERCYHWHECSTKCSLALLKLFAKHVSKVTSHVRRSFVTLTLTKTLKTAHLKEPVDNCRIGEGRRRSRKWTRDKMRSCSMCQCTTTM